MPATVGLDRAPPRPLELGAVVGVLDVVESGQLIWERAHVAATLNVVLAAHRVTAASVTANLTGEEGEVDQGEHVVDGVVMLGDPKSPADHAAIGPCIGMRGFANRLLRDAGDLLAELERVRLDVGGVRLVSRRS